MSADHEPDMPSDVWRIANALERIASALEAKQ